MAECTHSRITRGIAGRACGQTARAALICQTGDGRSEVVELCAGHAAYVLRRNHGAIVSIPSRAAVPSPEPTIAVLWYTSL